MKQRSIATLLICGGLLGTAVLGLEAAPQPQTANPAPATSTDQDAMQKIRKAIVADKSLSTYAHNVKIVAHEGKVTLRGPVRSETEKQAVADMAAAVVGADSVTNELTIQPAK
jgi:osmotically-inducible protein OsmY